MIGGANSGQEFVACQEQRAFDRLSIPDHTCLRTLNKYINHHAVFIASNKR